MEEGYFELIVGPMKSGKSKWLIDAFFQDMEEIEAYKPITDMRNIDEIVSRHYGKDMVIYCEQVASLENTKLKKDIIIVDEFQFFNAEELKDFVLKCKQNNKKLYMAGLDLLADRTEWSSYSAIKPLADKITKLKAKCSICCKPAEFTQKISGDKNKKIEIESKQTVYEPRCNNHYNI